MDHHYLARDLLFQLGQENKNSCSSSPSLPGYLPYLTIVSSCLSMLGCLLIILTFIIWKELRTTARAIVVFLSIADFFTAAGYCMAASVYIHFSGNSPRTLCRVQSFITSAFPTSSFLWTMHLAIYLFVAIVLDKPLLAKKLVILFHITGWGIPLAIDIPALATHHLGASHSQTSVDWCFVTFNYTNPNSTSEFHRRLAEYYSFELLCGKFWEITAYVVALSLYISIKVALKRRQVSFKYKF